MGQAVNASGGGPQPPFGTNPGAFAEEPYLNTLGKLWGLTLAEGMTAGYGVNDGHYDNHPIDARIWGGGMGVWSEEKHRQYMLKPKRVGLMQNISLNAPTAGGGKKHKYEPGVGNGAIYRMYFMFNPSEIQAAFNFNSGQIPPQYLGGNVQMIGGQTVSWSLFFDRTYEMAYSKKPENSRGVLQDVAALYNILGAFEPGANGIPFSYPVQVVFGQNQAGQLWGFAGYISAVNVTFGIFRWDMMPSRCEVDIAMTANYNLANIPATTAHPGTSGGGGNKPKKKRTPQGQTRVPPPRNPTARRAYDAAQAGAAHAAALKKKAEKTASAGYPGDMFIPGGP